MLRLIAISFVVVGAVALGYPMAAAVSHGLDPALWPPVVMTPGQWFESFLATYGLHNAAAYVHMASMRSPAFAGGGLIQILIICSIPTAFLVMLPSVKRGPRRDPDAIQGDARWANTGERAAMKKGLEFGLDRETGKPIRVAVEGNILSVAPPRRGKTSGLMVPNLAVADVNAWNGPAVVIDPKAEAFLAVAERRRDLGRHVRCLDPMNLCGGTDRWNPLAGLDPANIVYLQRVARALSFGKSRRGQIFQPAANRTRRNPGRTRHRGNAAVTRRPSLHRRKQAPASLIKACKQGLVACANRILVDHPVTIHSPQTTGNPLHFAADAPRFINSWASP